MLAIKSRKSTQKSPLSLMYLFLLVLVKEKLDTSLSPFTNVWKELARINVLLNAKIKKIKTNQYKQIRSLWESLPNLLLWKKLWCKSCNKNNLFSVGNAFSLDLKANTSYKDQGKVKHKVLYYFHLCYSFQQTYYSNFSKSPDNAGID